MVWINNGFKWILIQIILLVVVSFFYGNAAVFALGVIYLSIGLIAITLLFNKQKEMSINIFSFISLIYFIYTVITDSVYVIDPSSDYFFTLDSLKLYTEMDRLVKLDVSSSDILFYFRSFPGFGLLTWNIAKFADYVGQNAVLVQKLHVTLISSIIPVILYNIALNFYEKRRAIIISISFALLTHLFTYSALLLRDIHIMLFYTLGFYILLGKWSPKNILSLILITFLVWQFRVQNGIFFLMFVLAYIYIPLYKSKNLFINVLFSLLMVGIMAYGFSSGIFSVENEIEGKLSNYDEYHDNKLQQASGAATAIVALPMYVRPFVFIALSQFAPFPFYKATFVGTINETQLLLFPLAITTLFWILVLSFLVYGLSNSFYRKFIFKNLHFAFYIAMALIIVSAMSSPENRRLFPAYPIIYLAASFVYYSVSKSKRKNILRITLFGYAALTVVAVLL